MSVPFADKRSTVTVVVRSATGDRDAYGNPVFADTETDVDGCLIAPSGSQEDQNDADRVVDSASIYNLTGTWPDGTVNRVRFDDATWEVQGNPERWPGPIGGVVVQVRKVEG